jgi:hypothetical protein
VLGVAGFSDDLSRIYFASEDEIDGQGVAGRPNLYLYEETGSLPVTHYVATLAAEEVAKEGFVSDTTFQPYHHVARATPDGSALAFISKEQLTGFDNADINTNEPTSEVFVYRAGGSGSLSCVSCGPNGARPAGRQIEINGSPFLQAAAILPVGQNSLFSPRAISDDGSKVFFTSYADLIPMDTNEKADAYEWESPGSGSCAGVSDPAYQALNGGCLYLISSGTGDQDSEFVDSTATGRDVFFSTGTSLLSQDPGLIDIYDAREGGGFPPASPPTPPCQGEACQARVSPPPPPAPASSSSGPGNPKLKCPKGSHKVKRNGNPHCIRNKAKRKGSKKSHRGHERGHKTRRVS